MKTKMIVKNKIERWKTIFDDMPGFKCDIRTIIFKVNKGMKEVEVEQQFWFKTMRVRTYRSKRVYSRVRDYYRSLDRASNKYECGHYEQGDRFIFWVSVKVWG